MATIKIKDLVSSCLKKGFIRVEGSKHHRLVFCNNGKKTSIHTLYSRNAQEISDSLISSMAKQIKLSNHDFIAFIECHISQDSYIELVKNYIS